MRAPVYISTYVYIYIWCPENSKILHASASGRAEERSSVLRAREGGPIGRRDVQGRESNREDSFCHGDRSQKSTFGAAGRRRPGNSDDVTDGARQWSLGNYLSLSLSLLSDSRRARLSRRSLLRLLRIQLCAPCCVVNVRDYRSVERKPQPERSKL